MKLKNLKYFLAGENKISISQTSKGIWYCNDLTIYCKDIFDGLQTIDAAMVAVEEITNEKNNNLGEKTK
jgi:hypothetical protein